eukprot:TRINITY_DN10142_c0_g1_i1.p1 TRINITY_DN10142_c0_g1~~TRINITY_DN10142_c0_g1_i1.p1  ORF type:complete len:1079 (+),score=138.74 TRINITY_DN10142_c0_g1_i1:261-3239(+)
MDGGASSGSIKIRTCNAVNYLTYHYADEPEDGAGAKWQPGAWVKTEYCWYYLDQPSARYRPYFDEEAIKEYDRGYRAGTAWRKSGRTPLPPSAGGPRKRASGGKSGAATVPDKLQEVFIPDGLVRQLGLATMFLRDGIPNTDEFATHQERLSQAFREAHPNSFPVPGPELALKSIAQLDTGRFYVIQGPSKRRFAVYVVRQGVGRLACTAYETALEEYANLWPEKELFLTGAYVRLPSPCSAAPISVDLPPALQLDGGKIVTPFPFSELEVTLPGRENTVFNRALPFACRYLYDLQAPRWTFLKEELSCSQGLQEGLSLPAKHRCVTVRPHDFVYFLRSSCSKAPTTSPQTDSDAEDGEEEAEDVVEDVLEAQDVDESSDSVLLVGQILAVQGDELTIREFPAAWQEPSKGSPLDPKSHVCRDTRLLTAEGSVHKIQAAEIVDKCFVLATDELKRMDITKEYWSVVPDTFYVDGKRTWPELSVEGREELLRNWDVFWGPVLTQRSRMGGPIAEAEQAIKCKQVHFPRSLNLLELFACSGGSSTGWEWSGVVNPRFAVEVDRAAAETYQHNHKHSQVFVQDVNRVLQKVVGALPWDKEETPITAAAVDMISMGPPCQGFSRCNRFPKADSPTNKLIMPSLAFVEHLQPAYMLLENVKAITHYRLGAQQVRPTKIDGGIRGGVPKYILLCLLHLGYQVSIGCLHVGNYGLAQQRVRFLVWASLAGNKLPYFPQPHTACARRVVVDTTITTMGRPFSVMTGLYARHPRTTCADVIGDLPEMHLTYTGINHRDDPIGKKGKHSVSATQYNQQPWSGFQRLMRVGLSSGTLKNHETQPQSNLNTARICRVAMRPDADHLTIEPRDLDAKCLFHTESKASAHNNWKGLFGRLGWDGLFQTSLTSISPMSMQGKTIHPNQRRTLSVRECARIQSFPDWFEFKGNPRQQHMMIGNAIPPLLAFHLGCQLRDALGVSKEPESQRKGTKRESSQPLPPKRRR